MSTALRWVLGVCCSLLSVWAGAPTDDDVLGLDVFPDVAVHPITPLAYGVNEGGIDACPLRRHGGNRFTGFNWETSASNAGSDWHHQSDHYLASEQPLRGPGLLLAQRVAADRARGARSLVTVQLAGYVSADAAGPVTEAERAPGIRWQRVVLEASEPRPGGPDLADGVVYLDEQVRDLVARFGLAEDGGVLAYALDNEPALWPITHPRLHADAPTYAELVEKGVAAARLITATDPGAQVFGPVLYGWAAFHDLQGASDAKRHSHRHPTFIDHYLARMREASDEAGRRLLHRLDLHWYPEAMGDERIVGGDISPGTSRARVQAPRSLWDASYRERSWISDVLGEPIALLPRLKRSIDAHYPGTGIAVTEYNFGAAQHISGGLAQADALGLFGRFGVAACWWDLGGGTEYVQAAFKLFLDYDGLGGRFGDLSVHSLSEDVEAVSLHAASFGMAEGAAEKQVLTVLALHKDFERSRRVHVRLHLGGRAARVVSSWRFDGQSAELRSVDPAVESSSEGFTAILSPASATLFVVEVEALSKP